MQILPNPYKVEKLSGTFSLTKDSVIYYNSDFSAQAKLFARLVEQSCGDCLSFTDEIEQAQIIFAKNDNTHSEGYTLMISQGVATVNAGTPQGCFYAVNTLRQVFNLDSKQEVITCANCYIEDKPKFAHRGLMVDIARHFYGVDTLKQIVELMSQVKLNRLHLHLTDDQGFRIQIDKYPRLTEVSSVRQGTEVVKGGKRYVDDQIHGGYLTKDEIRQLIDYAAERNVEIIPELDVPGHLVAALAAYPEYSCTHQVSEVRKLWGISKDILCAGNDSSYVFIQDILDEIVELFPCEYVHLGGDEAPKDRWCNCKLCRERMAELKLDDYDELQTHMLEVFRAHLETKGKKVICWNDGITSSAHTDIVSQLWKPLNYKKAAKSATKQGRKVILSPHFHLYFDYPYALTPLHKTLNFNPCNGLSSAQRDNILGVEAPLWTEYVTSSDKLYFQLLPRLDALAEVCWGWSKHGYVKRVARRMELYENLGLCYNKQALKRALVGRATTVRKFFRKDSDVEFSQNQ
ncbi:MAG: beta-N-acetylhexosaminidase [Clostridiales bacterium]|nr:beta-N-acetylhexosaminidase [Clostridiales bacterium]